jgi:hypothetical protein
MSRHVKNRNMATDVWIYKDVLIERNKLSGMYTAWGGWQMTADTRSGIRGWVRYWRENSEGKMPG